ncbi:MAG: hypothetical protein QGH45_06565, partial [Myxococcota bacterium]|nr:hypothetical protein [Myxococcota bacterium]
ILIRGKDGEGSCSVRRSTEGGGSTWTTLLAAVAGLMLAAAGCTDYDVTDEGDTYPPLGDDDDNGDDDDDTGIGDDDTGDDDTGVGDDDTGPGDDDTGPSDDDTGPGDDDTWPGDDDTEPPHDDLPAPHTSGRYDMADGVSCLGSLAPIAAGDPLAAVATLLALGLLALHRRRR